MKKIKVKCPYCGALATLRPASVVHGERAKHSDLYVCNRYPVCDAYVSVHKKSHMPMGTLANGELRRQRMEAHRLFNKLWSSGMMYKWQAYKWLQAKFGLSSDQAHIGKFSEYMCGQLIRECEQVLANNHMAA